MVRVFSKIIMGTWGSLAISGNLNHYIKNCFYGKLCSKCLATDLETNYWNAACLGTVCRSTFITQIVNEKGNDICSALTETYCTYSSITIL